MSDTLPPFIGLMYHDYRKARRHQIDILLQTQGWEKLSLIEFYHAIRSSVNRLPNIVSNRFWLWNVIWFVKLQFEAIKSCCRSSNKETD